MDVNDYSAYMEKYLSYVRNKYETFCSYKNKNPFFLITLLSGMSLFIIGLVVISKIIGKTVATPAPKTLVAQAFQPKPAPTPAPVEQKKAAEEPQKEVHTYADKIKDIYHKIQLAEIEEEFTKRKVNIEKMKKELDDKEKMQIEKEFKESLQNDAITITPSLTATSTETVENAAENQNTLKKIKEKKNKVPYKVLLVYMDKSNHSAVATLTDDTKTIDVQVGDVLPGKIKVINISEDSVIFERKEKFFKKYIE